MKVELLIQIQNWGLVIFFKYTNLPKAQPQFTGDFVDQYFYAMGAQDGELSLEN